MAWVATAIVGGTLLAGKIQSNRTKDPKAAIGSGTAPTLSPGEGGGFTPIQGSELNTFGDFEYENMAEPELDQEAQLLAILQQAGVSPEELGITGLAFGGKIDHKANGGGIGALLSNKEELEKLKEMITSLPDRPNMDVIDFTSIEEPDLGDIMVEQLEVDAKSLVPSIDPPDVPLTEVPTGLENMKIGVENFAEANPQLFNAGIGALGQVLTALLIDMPEAPGSMVRTQTLPGNAARRRNQLQNISPIGGSTVDFAADGKVLQKPMDMNEIIEMLAQSNTQTGRSISDKDREFYSQLLKGATETDIINLLAQSNTQTGRSISDKDLEFYRSIAQGKKNGGKVLQRPMFMPDGGPMNGPGGPKDDLIPVMASNGEYMLSKAAVDAAGGGSHAKGVAVLDKFNEMGNKRYGV